jgi:hypothetical protein
VLAAYAPAFLRRISVDARGQLTSIDFGSCAQDTWDVCGRESVRRLMLGASYRF